jgi:sulfatase modifying factor 1
MTVRSDAPLVPAGGRFVIAGSNAAIPGTPLERWNRTEFKFTLSELDTIELYSEGTLIAELSWDSATWPWTTDTTMALDDAALAAPADPTDRANWCDGSGSYTVSGTPYVGTPGAANGSCPTLGAPCSSDSECAADEWCPTDTSERRCSPRPTVGGAQLAFQWVPSGEYAMGSPSEETGRFSNEEQVSVTLTRATFVSRTEVTQGEWMAVVEAWNALPASERVMPGWAGSTPLFGMTPSCFASTSGVTCDSGSRPDGPVERVSWWDALVFANALSALQGLPMCYELTGCGTGAGIAGVGGGCEGASTSCSSGTFSCSGVSFVGTGCAGYRLPTEAEWEFAARSGTVMATYAGDLDGTGCAASQGTLNPIAWYTCNSGGRTRDVGTKEPNAWGLFDTIGNVWEWAWSQYSDAIDGGSDPVGSGLGATRVLRGGAWSVSAASARAATRNSLGPATRNHTIGFRLVRTAP